MSRPRCSPLRRSRSFFGIVRSADAGKAIIFITHKLKEVSRSPTGSPCCGVDDCGGSHSREGADVELAEMMVGRPVELVVAKDDAIPVTPFLRSKDWWCSTTAIIPWSSQVSFTVRAGEIVGIAGARNGQTELVESLTGLREVLSGSIALLGQNITGCHPP